MCSFENSHRALRSLDLRSRHVEFDTFGILIHKIGLSATWTTRWKAVKQGMLGTTSHFSIKSLIFPGYIECTVVPILMVFLVGCSLNFSHDALMTCAAVASKSPAVGPWLMGKACTGHRKHEKHRKPGCVRHDSMIPSFLVSIQLVEVAIFPEVEGSGSEQENDEMDHLYSSRYWYTYISYTII